MKRKSYDLIMSIGAACSCTQGLRDAGLQYASYPLDWLFGTTFSGRIEILKNRFNRFIEQDDLEYVFSERSIKCDAYHNNFNNLTFNHDFPTKVPLKKSYKEIKEKYDRRIQRVLDIIDNSKSVLLVYVEIPDTKERTSDKTIQNCIKTIRKSFNNPNIDILYVTFDSKMEHGICTTKIIDNGITRVYGNYKSLNKTEPSYAVQKKELSTLLKKHALLKEPFAKIFRRFLIKTVIKIIPSHKIRVNMRKKFHFK